MTSAIKIVGARIHNLKNIDVEIPKGKLTVITGVSGSGKSSLAFDTLYEESKRRYLMFSNTQFMVDNVPTFDAITGLSPAVAVEQRITRQSNPRSNVGTRTKIGSMLAALFAAYGKRDSEYDDSEPLSMEMFQKNSPKGMCVRCLGSGMVYTVDEDELFRDKTRTLANFFGNEGKEGKTAHWGHRIKHFCKHAGLSPQQTLESLTEKELNLFKYGGAGYKIMDGVVPWVINWYQWSIKRKNPLWGAHLTCVRHIDCPKCKGSGLGEEAAHTTFGGKTITQLEEMYISDLFAFLSQPCHPSTKLLEEILTKLECMADVGLHHLALERPLPTLSGGEVQRLFLASYIIAEMDSIIFIFDEPTIGLHEVEKQKLIEIIQNLIRRGNTVVAVEHDVNFMQAADYIVDLGPRAGEYGGERIFQGSYADFMRAERSMTAPYLNGTLQMPVKMSCKPVDKTKRLRLEGCNLHNLRNVSVDIPLGLLVGVAGVSGSGKSSLIADTLVPKLKEVLANNVVDEFGYNSEAEENIIFSEAAITGHEHIKKCLIIDQKPIGRTRTSCPATYTGIFDKVRKLFADSPEAAACGYDMGMFSFNAQGQCRKCRSDGVIHYHVGFGNFIHVDCEDCGGTGFNPDAMRIKVDGKNIKDILETSVSSAVKYFKDKSKSAHRMLQTLDRVGLGYMTLGQKTPTISGGEAQRIKLAKELGKSGSGRNNLYILDEPTTGLSFSDAEKLIALMQELVDNGNTVIVTEHDPVVLANCDYIIEMGPGGGSDGGYVLATGTPEELRRNKESIIGQFLQPTPTGVRM
ncbi:MAG: excinuclease ABC subunit UvrA [Defluviitaleaceae bacterium]|nr:excinuclease ABC subunit UvrA [Defluviitaleaceae bacterium]